MIPSNTPTPLIIVHEYPRPIHHYCLTCRSTLSNRQLVNHLRLGHRIDADTTDFDHLGNETPD